MLAAAYPGGAGYGLAVPAALWLLAIVVAVTEACRRR
jgi:hypothetical protein